MYTSIISSDELNALLGKDDIVIVDTRFNLKDKGEGRRLYSESHIPGAVYAHLDDDLSNEIIPSITGRHPWPTNDKMVRLFSSWGISEDTQVVVYDQHHGGIASRLWAMLLYCGHMKVAVLNGGWRKWTTDNYETSADVFISNLANFQIRPALLKLVNRNDLNKVSCLIDARAEQRYLGLNEPIDPIAGHIPNAINYPFVNNLNADFEWLPKEKIAERFADINKEESIIMYCGSGVTACHNILAMKYAGLKLPALYPGSWSEYIIDPTRSMS